MSFLTNIVFTVAGRLYKLDCERSQMIARMQESLAMLDTNKLGSLCQARSDLFAGSMQRLSNEQLSAYVVKIQDATNNVASLADSLKFTSDWTIKTDIKLQYNMPLEYDAEQSGVSFDDLDVMVRLSLIDAFIKCADVANIPDVKISFHNPITQEEEIISLSLVNIKNYLRTDPDSELCKLTVEIKNKLFSSRLSDAFADNAAILARYPGSDIAGATYAAMEQRDPLAPNYNPSHRLERSLSAEEFMEFAIAFIENSNF